LLQCSINDYCIIKNQDKKCSISNLMLIIATASSGGIGILTLGLKLGINFFKGFGNSA